MKIFAGKNHTILIHQYHGAIYTLWCDPKLGGQVKAQKTTKTSEKRKKNYPSTQLFLQLGNFNMLPPYTKIYYYGLSYHFKDTYNMSILLLINIFFRVIFYS